MPRLKDVSAHGAGIWSRIGSNMGIDATKPPAKTDPERRARFERNRPMGWTRVFLKDFID